MENVSYHCQMFKSQVSMDNECSNSQFDNALNNCCIANSLKTCLPVGKVVNCKLKITLGGRA